MALNFEQILAKRPAKPGLAALTAAIDDVEQCLASARTASAEAEAKRRAALLTATDAEMMALAQHAAEEKLAEDRLAELLVEMRASIPTARTHDASEELGRLAAEVAQHMAAFLEAAPAFEGLAMQLAAICRLEHAASEAVNTFHRLRRHHEQQGIDVSDIPAMSPPAFQWFGSSQHGEDGFASNTYLGRATPDGQLIWVPPKSSNQMERAVSYASGLVTPQLVAHRREATVQPPAIQPSTSAGVPFTTLGIPAAQSAKFAHLKGRPGMFQHLRGDTP